MIWNEDKKKEIGMDSDNEEQGKEKRRQKGRRRWLGKVNLTLSRYGGENGEEKMEGKTRKMSNRESDFQL